MRALLSLLLVAAATAAAPRKSGFFIQWGTWTCPSGTRSLGWGRTAGAWYDHRGSGTGDAECLHHTAQYHSGTTNQQDTISIMYPSEIEAADSQTTISELRAGHQRSFYCARCWAPQKEVWTQVGSDQCPGGTTTLVQGIWAGESYTHYKSAGICMNRNISPYGSAGNENGMLRYQTEYEQDARPGAFNDAEVTCAVCASATDDVDHFFTHWGRGSCPAGTAAVVQSARVLGGHYDHRGGEINKLCVGTVSYWKNDRANQNGNLLYRTEYERTGSFGEYDGLHDREAECSTCRSPRTFGFTVHGRSVCPSGWTREYAGVVMSTSYTQTRSSYNCVARNPTGVGSAGNENGALWYTTEYQANVGSSYGYQNDREAHCAYCTGNTGPVFTRWGRTDCPAASTRLYWGLAAGSHYEHGGAGHEMLCLPSNGPNTQEGNSGNNDGSLLYRVEYEMTNSDFSHLRGVHDKDVPCAVCAATRRNSQTTEPTATFMLSGTYTCPSPAYPLYTGFLVGERYTHHRSSLDCLDYNPQASSGSSDPNGNSNGRLIYQVETRHGVTGYSDGYDLACVVCAIPADPYCGDNIVNNGEQCDDGNDDNSDSCVECRHARCGDNHVRTGVEQCDDGNTITTDACTAQCTNAVCGDGSIATGAEECEGSSTHCSSCATRIDESVTTVSSEAFSVTLTFSVANVVNTIAITSYDIELDDPSRGTVSTLSHPAAGHLGKTPAPMTIPSLTPGTAYRARIRPRTSLGLETEAKWSSWIDTPTHCGCSSSNTDGTPAAFNAWQEAGAIRFSWSDASVCDDRYTLRANGAVIETITAADVTGCGTEYQPAFVHSLGPVGSTVVYTVEATGATSGSSSRASSSVVIKWSTTVQGFIKPPGQTAPNARGLEGATVTIVALGDAESAVTTTTSATGFYREVIESSAITTTTSTVEITPYYEGEDGTVHEFACGLSVDNDCTEALYEATHNAQSTDLYFIDNSVLTISGVVQYDTIALCPVEGAKVCLIDLDAPSAASENCEETGPTGEYTLSAVFDSNVELTVTYLDHTFTTDQWTYTMTTFFQDVVLLDTTERTLDLTVGGGMCNTYLGPSSFIVRGTKCGYEESFTVSTSRNTYLPSQLLLPAMELDVTFEKLCDRNIANDCPGQEGFEFVDGVDFFVSMVNQFTSRGERVQNANLLEEPAELLYRYQNPPVTSLSGFPVKEQCGSDVYVARMLLEYYVTLSVYETYGDGPTQVCNHVGGEFHIEDVIGLEGDPCHQNQGGCDLPVVFDGSVSSVEFNVTAGLPDVIEFTKELYYQYRGIFQGETVPIEVFVNGFKSRGNAFSMKLPSAVPYMILRDPPGGESFSEVSQSVALSQAIGVSKGKGNSVGGNGYVFAGYEGETEVCVGGLFIGVCTETISFEGGAKIGGGGSNEDSWTDLQETVMTTTLTETFTTSEGAENAGAPADRFFLPAINILVTKIDIVRFNESTCGMDASLDISWNLDAEQEFNSLVFKSAQDIQEFEIPALEEALDVEVNRPEPDAFKVHNLEVGIDSWQSVLALNNELKRTAVPFTGGLSQSFTDSSGATVNDENDQTVISFSGGGGTYTLESTTEITRTTTHEVESVVTEEFFTEFEAQVSVVGVTVGAGGEVALDWTVTTGASETNEYTSERTEAFTLADPDSNDQFDVAILTDNAYGLVFNTIAGQSRCIAENGTVPRDDIDISVQGLASRANIPPEETLSFTFLLSSSSPTRETLPYLLIPDPLTLNGLVVDQFAGQMEGIILELPPGDSEFEITVRRADGSTQFSFPEITFLIYPDCPDLNNPDLPDQVTLSIEYVTPCATIQWSDEMQASLTEVVNGVQPDQMALDLVNPYYFTRPWATDPRLETVHVYFRPQGGDEASWSFAKYFRVGDDAIDNQHNAKHDENDFGLARYYWWTAPQDGVADGAYEVRAQAVCTPSGVDDSLDVSYSDILTVFVDRKAPEMFGFPEPTDGEYVPGDSIIAEFDELLDCNPLVEWTVSFTAPVTVDGQETTETVPFKAICEMRTVIIELHVGTVPYDIFMGKTVTATVNRLQDIYGNQQEIPTSWTFSIGTINTATALVKMNGLRFDIDYIQLQQIRAREQFMDDVTGSVAVALEVDPNRIDVVSVYPGSVLVDFRFLPATASDPRSAMELATAFHKYATEISQDASLTGPLGDLEYTEAPRLAIQSALATGGDGDGLVDGPSVGDDDDSSDGDAGTKKSVDGLVAGVAAMGALFVVAVVMLGLILYRVNTVSRKVDYMQVGDRDNIPLQSM